MTSYLIVVNPVSGRGRGRRNSDALVAELSRSARVEVLETRERGDAVELAATRAGDFDRIVAVGGDGTLNEVVRGLMSVGRPAAELPELCFLPSGTANAATRAFGLGSAPEAVAQALPRARSRPVDVGVARHSGGERPFLLWCGAGYDAVVIETLNASRTGTMGLAGLGRNMPRILHAIADYAAPEIEVEIDGSSWGAVSTVVLANVADLAFGGTFVDGADPFDGRLDVVGVPVESKLRIPRRAVAILTSSLHRSSGVRHGTATEVSIRSRGAVPFQVDGEPAGELPVDVRLEAGAVRLVLT